MSEGKQLRLGQVARKLNVGRNTIISYLHDKGYEIDSNPNTKIDDDLFRILENAFEDSAVEKKVASNIKIGLEEKSNMSPEFKKDIKTVETFRIQVYSGSSSSAASNVKAEFKQSYGQWPVEMVFNTPNYKIWVGNFRDRLEADRALLRIKKSYMNAFIFKPKKD